MKIDFLPENATWISNAAGSFLCIPVADPEKELGQMERGKTYTAEIKRKKQRRSLDANSLYWELCGKLAQEVGLSPAEVYRQHIADIGNYEVYGVRTEAVPMFEKLWTSGHLGRFIETRAARSDGITNVLAYYGSSDFNTEQMSRLIDHCIQDCKALGIDTKSPEEVESLLSQWQ